MKKFFSNLLPFIKSETRFKTSLITFLILLIIYSLIRLVFYFVNNSFYHDTKFDDLLLSFLIGIRFDIAAIVMLNLPVIILYNFPINWSKIKYSFQIIFILFCILNLLGITLNIADLGYYPTIQRRLTFEPFTAIDDTIRMIPALFKNYAHLIIAFIISVFAFVYSSKKLFQKIGFANSNFSFKKSFFFFVFIISLSVIGIRGGLQLKPIRQTNAFFSDNRPLGYLALNTTYTVLRSYFQYSLPEYHFYNQNEIINEVQELVYSNDEKMIDNDFVFMRRKNPIKQINKKNIVIFIMESWSAQYVGSITGGKTSTPFFDSLAKKGILFTNFFASGQRSIEAVPAILASIPAVFPKSFIGSQVETNKIRGLGSILKEYGYTTSFHHGALRGSMGFDGFVPSAGFDLYFSKDDFENYADSLFDGTWGIYDEPFFIDAAKKMSRFDQPFCSVIFSLSSHDPFKIPSSRKNMIENFKDENEFQHAIRYSDFALQKFFEFAKTQPWFENTVFIFTGDHTLYTARNDIFSSFNVPLLIYSPKENNPQIIHKVGSHVDILPTILDLLNISSVHSSMGSSLLDKSKEGFAVTSFYPSFLFFSNKNLYVDDFDQKQQYFEDFKNTKPQANIFETNKEKSLKLQRKLKSYIQAVTNAVNHDLIYKTN